jgi:hypothetical protein
MGFERRLNIDNPVVWDFHRSGWKFAIDGLVENFHRPNGVKLISHFETNVATDSPILCPWIGFLHNTPEHPECMSSYGKFDLSLSKISKSEIWKQSKDYCKGLFTLSNYCKKWVENNMFSKVCFIFHPTEDCKQKFNLNHIESNNSKIISIGHWMRRLESFSSINCKYEKIMLTGPFHDKIIIQNDKSIIYKKFVTNEIYDNLLSKNLVFVDLYDSSANNVVIECIVRNTPIIINKIPGTVEYLGENYPLFFENISEASEKISNKNLIKEAYQYLFSMNKDFLKIENFILEFGNSKIYKSLSTKLI